MNASSVEKKDKEKIVIIAGVDRDYVYYKSKLIVEANKAKGFKPELYYMKENSIADVFEKMGQGSLFGGSDFIWLLDAENVAKEETTLLKKNLEKADARNILITACESSFEKLERWKDIASIPGVKALIADRIDVETYKRELISYAKRYGKRLDDGAAIELIERSSGRFGIAINELSKMVMYYGDDKKTIYRNDVREFVKVSTEANVFDFVNSILSRNAEKAFETLSLVLLSGEKEDAVFYILLKQFDQFVKAAIRFKIGLSPKDLKLETWQLRKYRTFSRKWKWGELAEAFWLLLETDARYKRGELRDLKLALKMFIARTLLPQRVSSQV